MATQPPYLLNLKNKSDLGKFPPRLRTDRETVEASATRGHQGNAQTWFLPPTMDAAASPTTKSEVPCQEEAPESLSQTRASASTSKTPSSSFRYIKRADLSSRFITVIVLITDSSFQPDATAVSAHPSTGSDFST